MPYAAADVRTFRSSSVNNRTRSWRFLERTGPATWPFRPHTFFSLSPRRDRLTWGLRPGQGVIESCCMPARVKTGLAKLR